MMDNTRSETIVQADQPVEFDTSFVLFFLAMDIGQKAGFLSVDGVTMIAALAAVMLLPFLLTGGEQGSFREWVVGRGVIAGFGLVSGAAFGMGVGTLFPEMFSFLPFTLLIMSAMATVFLTFSSLLGFRRG